MQKKMKQKSEKNDENSKIDKEDIRKERDN